MHTKYYYILSVPIKNHLIIFINHLKKANKQTPPPQKKKIIIMYF